MPKGTSGSFAWDHDVSFQAKAGPTTTNVPQRDRSGLSLEDDEALERLSNKDSRDHVWSEYDAGGSGTAYPVGVIRL